MGPIGRSDTSLLIRNISVNFMLFCLFYLIFEMYVYSSTLGNKNCGLWLRHHRRSATVRTHKLTDFPVTWSQIVTDYHTKRIIYVEDHLSMAGTWTVS